MQYPHTCQRKIDPGEALRSTYPRLDGWPFHFFLYAVLTSAVFIVYSDVYQNAFLYDDEATIAHNQFLQNWGYWRSVFLTSLSAGSNLPNPYYRPIQTLLYMAVFQMAGLSLFAFHLLNIILHSINACLVYKLGQKLRYKWPTAFFAALLWALHPLQTEAVTYMSSTGELLYSLFCLLGMIALLPDFTSRRVLLVIPLMILAFLSKESAVSFPLLAMACLYSQSSKRFDPKTYFQLWPLIFITAAYVVLHYIIISPSEALPNVSPSPYVFSYAPLATLPCYVGLLFVPLHLHMGHELPVYRDIGHLGVLGGLGLAILAIIQILREHPGRSLPISWGLFWFGAALLPPFPTSAIFYEHWLYLPSAGLFLGVGQTIALSLERIPPPLLRRVTAGAGTVVMLAIGIAAILTYQQNVIWRDPITFYNNIFVQGEKAANAHANLGAFYLQQGDYEKAIEQTQIALKNSSDPLPTAETNLAIAQLLLPDGRSHPEEALMHLQHALDIDPSFYPAYNALSLFYNEQGDAAQSKIYRDKADEIRKKFLTIP